VKGEQGVNCDKQIKSEIVDLFALASGGFVETPAVRGGV
jgi:hypothetical protein